MKKLFLPTAIAIAAGAISASAQTLPITPQAAGLTPLTPTTWVNGVGEVNNNSTESLSVGIINDGKIVVGWEDDGSGITDTESMWTVLNPNGDKFLPLGTIANTSTLGADGTLESYTTKIYSYIRSDNTLAPGYMGWGPVVKANRFGNGFGMAAMPWEIGLEIPELYDINMDDSAGGVLANSSDFPAIQLLNNDGTAARPGAVSGVHNLGIVTFLDANVQPAGSIRIGGWEYLANGNIVVVGESRQNDDKTAIGLVGSGNVPYFRIVTPSGDAITPARDYVPVSSTPTVGGYIARHGVGVTANGFAVRWQDAVNGTTVRMFDNSGNPTTQNITLSTINANANGGGDGGEAGISGNGTDAYVVVGDYGAGTGVWVTVLNADGSVRWSKTVADDLTLTGVNGTSAAIDPSGLVVVTFAAQPDPGLSQMALGRCFTAAGNPVGGTFYIGEQEPPNLALPALPAIRPKVDLRNGKITVAWLSQNNPDPSLTYVPTIALRSFLAPPSLTIVPSSGGNVTVSWPLAITGFTLESTTSLAGVPTWTTVGGVVNNSVTVSAAGASKFYRLKQ